MPYPQNAASSLQLPFEQSIRRAQELVADISLQDPFDAPLKAVEWLSDWPSAVTGVDDRLLRALLVTFALRLIEYTHGAGTPCTCVVSAVQGLARCAHGNAARAIDDVIDWLRTYAQTYRLSHSRTPAEMAAALIRASTTAPFDPQRLASACACSLSSLRLHFKARYHMSMTQYQHLARVDAAITAMMRQHTKIESVARHVGYLSKKDFYRAFRVATGTTPRAFQLLDIDRKDAVTTAVRFRLLRGSLQNNPTM